MRIERGTAYCPENRDRKRILHDAELMQSAGIRYVRMGGSAWSHFEPVEGDYRMEWMEEAIAIMGRYGIRTVLCTPSAAAPASSRTY